MAHSGTKITAPVQILGDLQPVLGTSYKGLGQIITTANINPMSKMKPVGFPSVAPNRTGTTPVGGQNLWWWQGIPSYQIIPAGLVIGNYTCIDKCVWVTNCGVKMLGFFSKLDFLRALNPLLNPFHTGDNSPLKDNYSYVPPTGDINNEPFRLLDFNHYDGSLDHNTIPDVGTETGTTLVNANNPEAARVTCSVMSAAVSNYGAPSRLSFNDLYGTIGSFTIVAGILASGSNINLTTISVESTRSDEFFKEVKINLNDSQVWEQTVIAMYAVAVRYGIDTFYIPVMQSTLDHPNTPISYAPRRRMYNSWRVTRATPYYAMTMQQKQDWRTSVAYVNIPTTSFTFDRSNNIWYLKLGIPRPATGQGASTYTFHNGCVKVDFTGEFRDAGGSLRFLTYSLTYEDTSFIVKNEDPNTQHWTNTQTIYVTPGTGVVTCFLAIENVFADRHAQVVTRGGSVWRIRLFLKKNGQTDFSPEPDLVYGGLTTATRIYMNV